MGTTARAATRDLKTARAFDFHVSTLSGQTRIEFIAGSPTQGDPALQPTLGVQVNYRKNFGAELITKDLAAESDGVFALQTSDIAAGDVLDFYFTQTVGPDHTNQAAQEPTISPCGAPWCREDIHFADPRYPSDPTRFLDKYPVNNPVIDSAWFHQVVGQPDTPEPNYPLVTRVGARFRDRHPNEWRFDHFVAGYDGGRSFDLTITDHGTSLDFEVTLDPAFDLTTLTRYATKDGVDIKFFDGFGQTPFCNGPPAQSEVGTYMIQAGDMSSHTFKYTLEGVSYGQLVDTEFTFSRTGKNADGDDNATYYTEFFHYRVGTGRMGRKWQHPYAYAASEASVTRISTDQFSFAQHIPSLSPDALRNFLSGKILFESEFATHALLNLQTAYDCDNGSIVLGGFPPEQNKNPLFSAASHAYDDILGPQYSQASCLTCHHLDGKGPLPDNTGLNSMIIKLQSSASGAVGPDPDYGVQFDAQAVAGATSEGTATVSYRELPGHFDDGTAYSLRKPIIAFSNLAHGPFASTTAMSPRVALAVAGLGLLEAVPDATILGLADPDDADGDGISGKPNWVEDAKTGQKVLGRFGWKAGQPSIIQQAATAAANDMGITSSFFPGASGSAKAELSDDDLGLLESYLRGLSVPPRPQSNPLGDQHDQYGDPLAIAGKALFEQAQCGRCHTPNLVTSINAALPETSGLDIQPFTDLLLHDMGPDLADGFIEHDATGTEWRTPPLWGAGLHGAVLTIPPNDTTPTNYGTKPGDGHYLHDGRARTLLEAILWHGGEAAQSTKTVLAMSNQERASLLAYVAYPFADALPIPVCAPGYSPWDKSK